MVLSPQLEAHLQNARLGVLVPVLLDLGVEYCEDLKFMNEGDFGGRNDISMIQKRRFLEWRDKMLQASGDSSSEAESFCERQPRPSQLLDLTQDGTIRNLTKGHMEASPSARTQSSVDRSTAASTSGYRPPQVNGPPHDMPMSLPTQTPRTRAMPFVDVLRELENLDVALKDERERSSALVEEKQVLDQNHKRDMKMLEEMLAHAYVEIEQLKSTIVAWEHTKTNSLENIDDVDPNRDLNEERVTFAPRESVIEDEPEMEPRKTACSPMPNLALPRLELPSFGPG